MTSTKDVKQFSRSPSHLLKRAAQYSNLIYMGEVGKSGLTHRQFTVLLKIFAGAHGRLGVSACSRCATEGARDSLPARAGHHNAHARAARRAQASRSADC